MFSNSAQKFAFAIMASVMLLSGCGKEAKDDAMGQNITDCQLSAHSAMETSPLTDDQRRAAIGAYVEKCMRKGGLQPSNITESEDSCLEAAASTDSGKGLIKPLQKCWTNSNTTKGWHDLFTKHVGNSVQQTQNHVGLGSMQRTAPVWQKQHPDKNASAGD